MANRRMLSVSISVSEQVADLRDDFTRLLFTWMIAHADDWGVLPGSARKVRVLVIPHLDHTIAEVEEALSDMETHALIWRYCDASGTSWLQFRSWDIHQTGLHKRTEARQPRYIDSRKFPEVEVPGSSRTFRDFPSEQNRREENRREGKRTEEEGRADARDDGGVDESLTPVLVIPEPEPVPPKARPEPDPVVTLPPVKLSDRALSKLCGEIAHAAGAQLDAKGIRGLIEQHPTLDAKRIVFEVGLAAEWLADPAKNKAGKRRQMNIRFLHNWLTKAESPHTPPRASSSGRSRRVGDGDDEEPHVVPPEDIVPPDPEPLPPVNLRGYQELPQLWHTIATELRAMMSAPQFESAFGGARLMMPQQSDSAAADGMATLVFPARFTLEYSDRFAERIKRAFERVAPEITSLRRICRAQIMPATTHELKAAVAP